MPAHEAKKKDGRAASSAINLAKARATRLLKTQEPKETEVEVVPSAPIPVPEKKSKSKRQPLPLDSESESETEEEESSDDEDHVENVRAYVMRAAKKESKRTHKQPDPAVLSIQEQVAKLQEKLAKLEAPKSEPAVPQKPTPTYSSIFG